MPSANFINCGPRSCANAGALAASPTKLTNAAAALIVIKLLPWRLALRDADRKLSRDSRQSPVSEMAQDRRSHRRSRNVRFTQQTFCAAASPRRRWWAAQPGAGRQVSAWPKDRYPSACPRLDEAPHLSGRVLAFDRVHADLEELASGAGEAKIAVEVDRTPLVKVIVLHAGEPAAPCGIGYREHVLHRQTGIVTPLRSVHDLALGLLERCLNRR